MIANLNEGVSVPKQILSGMQQTLRNFGVQAGDMPSSVAQAQQMLNNLAIDNATEILKESGKTLSDNDRKLVAKIVGDLPGLLSGSPGELRKKLMQLKNEIVDRKRREILRAFQTMDNYSRSSTIELWGDSDWSDDDEKELIKLRKTQGVDS